MRRRQKQKTLCDACGCSLFGFANKQFRNPAVKIGRVICFHVNKVNMDNKVLKFRAVRAPAAQQRLPRKQ
jgi:hypothetical protein